jgi:hypothetical protein
MIRVVLIGLGAAWLMTGVIIFADPMGFYQAVPGLKQMGPFNAHFVRDVGLAFIASGGVLVWGAYRSVRGLAQAGIAWPAMHAVFHVHIWGHRGFPLDAVFAFDLTFVILPPFLALLFAHKLAKSDG